MARKPDGYQAGGHVADGDDPLGPTQTAVTQIDMNQRKAEESAAAAVLIAPASIVVLDDSLLRGRGCGLFGLDSPHQIVQTDDKIVGQGGQVAEIRGGGPRLPLLYRLPGDPYGVGQLLLGDAPPFAELVEPFTKFHGDEPPFFLGSS